MYKEIILTIIITLIIFLLLNNKDSRIDTFSTLTNKKYNVRKCEDQDKMNRKADFLANLDIKAHKIVDEMKSRSLPTKEIGEKVYTRFKNSIISETPENDSGAAYTINKGPISICIEKNDGSFFDEEDAFFVILHELAHVMSDSYGHGKEFQENFDFIVKLAVKLELWKDKNYQKNHKDYCGVEITTSPCDNDKCSQKQLNYFFQEKLI